MAFSGQPYADATATAQAGAEPTINDLMAVPGLPPGARDPFAPPAEMRQAPPGTSPVPAIQEAITAGQAPKIATDFADPTNLFAPSSGMVADRFRELQQLYGPSLEDEAPLTPLQIIGFTLGAIANPQAVQDALRRRRERMDRRAEQRRAINAELLRLASSSVATDADMRAKAAQLQLDQLRVESSIATDERQRALADAEIGLRSAQTEQTRLESENLRSFRGMEFGGSAAGIPGFEPEGLSFDEFGRPRRTFKPEASGYEIFEDALKQTAPTDQFGQTKPDTASQAAAFRLALARPDLTKRQRSELRAMQESLFGQPGATEPTLGAAGALPPGYNIVGELPPR